MFPVETMRLHWVGTTMATEIVSNGKYLGCYRCAVKRQCFRWQQCRPPCLYIRAERVPFLITPRWRGACGAPSW